MIFFSCDVHFVIQISKCVCSPRGQIYSLSEQVKKVVADCFSRGVELKWFGEANPHGFTSRYDSWRYVQSEPMAKTDRVLSGLLDLRLPLSFTKSDCKLIASIINNVVQKLFETSSTSDI